MTSAAVYPSDRSKAFWSYTIALPLALLLGFGIAAYSASLVVAPVIIAALVLIIWRPYWGYLLAVATLPADALGIIGSSSAPVVITVPKLVGALTVFAWGADILYRGQPLRLRRFLSLPTALVMIFLAWNVIACALHPTEKGVSEIVRLALITVFVLISVHFIDRPQRMIHVVLAIVITATLVSTQSVIQRVTGQVTSSEDWNAAAGAVLDVSEETTGEMLRTSGTFSHPAWLGLFLTTALPLTFFVIWTSRHALAKILACAAAVVQVLGVFSTYSRMAYIGVALGVGMFALRRRFGVGLLVTLLVCAVVIYPVLPEDFRTRAESIVDYGESSSSLSRIGQQLAGLAMFEHNAMVGVGPGNFESQVERFAGDVPERYRVQKIGAHNMYVEIAAELGVPGLVAILALVGIVLHHARRLRRHNLRRGYDLHRLLWEGIMTAAIVFLFSALFVHSQYRKEWWLLVALVAAGWTIRSSDDRLAQTTGQAA